MLKQIPNDLFYAKLETHSNNNNFSNAK